MQSAALRRQGASRVPGQDETDLCRERKICLFDFIMRPFPSLMNISAYLSLGSVLRLPRWLWVCLLSLTLASVSCGAAETVDVASLPTIHSQGYKSAPYIKAAMALQKMGRRLACKGLLLAAPGGKNDEQIFILCRMLFSKKKKGGFEPPSLGGPALIGGSKFSDWPLYPIELVDGVPFFVVRGFLGAGEGLHADYYLHYCMENCDWSKVEFSQKDSGQLKEALDKLLMSNKWRRPLTMEEREFLSKQVE